MLFVRENRSLFCGEKKNLSLFPAEFLQDGRYCFQSHSFWWGVYPPPPADSIWRMFMLLVRGEPFTFYCGGGGLKNCWSKVTAPKSKDSFIIFFFMRRTTILHNYFFMNEGGLLLADMLLLGRYCPVYPVKTTPRDISPEMRWVQIMWMFLFSNGKVFMVHSLSKVTVCTSQRTL